MTHSLLDVIVANRTPPDVLFVGTIIDLDLNVDPDIAAEAMRRVGLAIVLSKLTGISVGAPAPTIAATSHCGSPRSA